jgi:cytidine deaminase
MLDASEQLLVDVAEGIVRSLPAGEIHTVAAAAMDVNGDIHTGVNVFHFTGGP